MSHTLFRLKESILGVPHLISPQSFQPILDYLDSRDTIYIKKDLMSSSPIELSVGEKISDKVGLLNVHGTLTYKPVMTLCGEAGTSYMSLQEQFEELIAEGVKTVVMDISSGGGQGHACFETANDIRELADENGVEILAYVDECAASAAYAFACMADEVIANPMASVGSIGVLIALEDSSKKLEKEGIRKIYITAGNEKVPFAEDGSFKSEFLDDLKKQVTKLNSEFAGHVSKYTGLADETIMGFQAKLFDADEALDKGLINKIMTKKEFAAYVAEKNRSF